MSEREWAIRNSVAEDLPLIYDTWTQSYRYDSLIGKGCRNRIFFKEYYKVIDWILNQEDTQVVMAVKKEEPHVIFGYLVYQPDMVHYAYTKEDFREYGIARSLYEAAGEPKFFSQKTFSLIPIMKAHPDANFTFNPFVLFRQYVPGESDE